MKVVVTGGSGGVGKYVVEELLNSGYQVIVFDIKEPQNKNINFIKGNILEINDCMKAFRGTKAVIHLAAIPHPLNDPPETVFNTNVVGTFNVYQAAASLGVERIIQASSDSTYGFHFRKDGNMLLPVYLPIDEDHPQRPADPYGLSKKVCEEIAKAFSRRYYLMSICLRICWVWFPESVKEYGYDNNIKDPERWRTNLWAYEHVKDAALAFRLALEVRGLKKYEVFCISAVDNGTEFESMEIIKKYGYDKIPLIKNIEGRESLYNCFKARKILGYEPRYTWKDII